MIINNPVIQEKCATLINTDTAHIKSLSLLERIKFEADMVVLHSSFAKFGADNDNELLFQRALIVREICKMMEIER